MGVKYCAVCGQMVRYSEIAWYGKTMRLNGEEQYTAVCAQERCIKALSFAFMLYIMRQATKINPYASYLSTKQNKQEGI